MGNAKSNLRPPVTEAASNALWLAEQINDIFSPKPRPVLHHYSGALIAALGAAPWKDDVRFNAVPDTWNIDCITGIHKRQYRDNAGRRYTVTVTPHAMEDDNG